MSSGEVMRLDLSITIQEINSICSSTGSKSESFKYGSSGYKDSIRHFLASSSEVAQIAVQPGNVKDLCKIMRVLRRHRTVKFAVKGGGHGMAPGLSSTTEIHISMTRFSKIRYNSQTQLVEIGSGCLWDQVYSELGPVGRNVVGGASADGVGVGGWLLGGGYSLKSNRHGLGIDNVVEIEIVTPDGRARTVNRDTNRDLFQALRGGGNNFGIVTKFTLKTFAQNPSYGSYFMISGKRQEEFKKALVDFVENEERQEACVVAAFRHELVRGKADPEYTISIFCVFDAEKPKKKRNVPFQELARLQEKGETWKVDPAGWQLGRTNLSISDGSLRRNAPEPKKSSRPGTPQSRTSGVRNNRASSTRKYNDTAPPEYDDIFPGRKSHNRDYEGSDDGSDVSAPTGYFQEMSFREFHGVSYDSDDNDDDDSSTEESSASDYDDSDGSSDASDDYSHNDEPSSSEDDRASTRKMNFASKDTFKRSNKFRSDLQPRLMTKKIDKMGELNERGRFGCLMISRYTKPLLDKMAEEAEKAASHLKKRRGLSVIVDAWPVHQAMFDNSPPGAAFPHERGEPYGPMLAYFRWENEADDEFWLTKLKGTLNRIRVVARDLGLTPREPAYYNNLSLESVPVHKIYRDNMDWLQKVKARYDPTDVMGRCGVVHKIPLPDGDDEEDSDD